MRPERRWRLAAGASLLVVLLLAALVVAQTGLLRQVLHSDSLAALAVRLGPFGPALIIALMAIAIVMSPLPSAPIALAAGAVYGHAWGALYVAAGSVSGALIAFAIARFVGRDALRAWLGRRLPATGALQRYMSSQNALMAVVFITRLLPFLSFDVISYAAGLTPLRAWRFATATLLGIIPASFLLAHFGDELATGSLRGAALTVLALGGVTLLPWLWKALPRRHRATVRRRLSNGAERP